jgi:LAS superfamily LD-carboxypeptidase LdcB
MPTLKQLIGDVTPASDPDFAPIPTGLGPKGGMYANKQALAAFTKMHDTAKKDHVDLVIVSAFRSFNDQKRIWNDKWTGKTPVEGGKLPRTVPDPRARAEKILEFSSMPGTSRHHWGTDFDLNDLSNGYFALGKGRVIHDWLTAHAAEYGICQVYSPKGPDRPRGYNREDWHWSYLPVATRYLAAYPNVVGYERLTGFEGASTAKAIEVIPNYVQGINPDCQK